MPVNFLRLNERTRRPSDRVNFIESCGADSEPEEVIRRLEALVSLFHPILEQHDLRIGRLTDAQHNTGWAGRNWAAGEHVELVLRTRSGVWLDEGRLVRLMCHELAHNADMGHGKVFQETEQALIDELAVLIEGGWTGAGWWGRGERLGDEDSLSTSTPSALLGALATAASPCGTLPPAQAVIPPSAAPPSSSSTSPSSTSRQPSSSAPSSSHHARRSRPATTLNGRFSSSSNIRTLHTPKAASTRKSSSLSSTLKRRSLKTSFATEGARLGGEGKSIGCQTQSKTQRDRRLAAIEGRLAQKVSKGTEVLLLSDSDSD
ncbi:hypothetical protein NBRC10512_005943 [Rhodotorula toruloides]|uniref:RHTO0S02e01640g1_1 n=2 Tax=Rhodotorula toruloides TaxID=5286 RepID=A0A061AFP6_RHOTO|nr:WLM domain containing protein [Rhodotorula toruloides NP11]EMS22080.1 WLM domain containing protein [Rhodotorula toruloides NP11]KAJ8296231.1 DNA-dependent metalloprotease WSS1 [Rhodotorula toruloides]CDR36402.1 RHTO0S02e01640g1_1 [Rhodotorula toruloides]